MSYRDIFRNEYSIDKSEKITLELINSKVNNDSLKKSFAEDLVPITGNVFEINEDIISNTILDTPLPTNC